MSDPARVVSDRLGKSTRLTGMNWNSLINRVVKIGVREGMKFLKDSQKSSGTNPNRGATVDSARPGPGRSSRTDSSRADSHGGGGPTSDYPGDFHGRIRSEYSPNRDGNADPGEIVWGWIPFEEDHSQGKDRPSLIVGKDGQWVLALMLTSKDHIPGGFGEVRSDRNARWMNIGSGAWDAQRRPSEIRLDRVIRLRPDSIRREGAIMPRDVFETIVSEVDAA